MVGSLVRPIKINLAIVTTLFLVSCNSGGDSDSVEVGADPFIEHQWYLDNRGQSALSTYGSGGVGGADVNLPYAGSYAYAQGFTGSGVTIAIIDGDLEIAHEDLKPNVLLNASYNFFSDFNGKGLHDPTASINAPNPLGHHGTAVAGLAAAKGGNNIGIWGVAPSASLVGYNLLYGNSSIITELAALGDFNSAKNYPELYSRDVDVFNLSYGRNPYQETNENALYTSQFLAVLKTGTQTLRSGKGAVYVKAGGNEYFGGVEFDSDWCQQADLHELTCYNVNMEDENVTPYQMVIGGFNADDKRASYSNTGSALWLVAPAGEHGVHEPALITTDASGCSKGFSVSNPFFNSFLPYTSDFNTGEYGTGNESCNYFSAFNGTSASTPIVSGIVALLLEANPNLSWRDVKHILATTARQLDKDLAGKTKSIDVSGVVLLEAGWVENRAGYYYSNEYGFGAPDADAAIRMALDWKATNEVLAPFKETSVVFGALPIVPKVPDYNSIGLSTDVLVNEQLIIESVELVISIESLTGQLTGSVDNKIDMSDYQIVLRSPQGTESILLTPFNAYQSGHDMLNLKLISHAFYGEASQGSWTLIVRDLDRSTDNRINHVGEGKLTNWSLKAYGREGV